MSNTTEVTEISNLAELSVKQLKKLADTTNYKQLKKLFGLVVGILEKERTKIERLEEMTITDSLTGLRNRRRFEGYLTKFANRYPKSWVAILSFDIDHFKQVNDTLGHPVGDETLVAVAERLSANFRPNDLVCRMGGDEFAVIVTGIVSADLAQETGEDKHVFEENALMLAERARTAVADDTNVTVSVGLEVNKAEYFAALGPLVIVDAALYKAKNLGRNRIVRVESKQTQQ